LEHKLRFKEAFYEIQFALFIFARNFNKILIQSLWISFTYLSLYLLLPPVFIRLDLFSWCTLD
jgi:hypothetical protein